MTMNTFLRLALGVAALALPPAASVAATAFAPGYYETVTRVAGDPQPEVKRECVTPAEAQARSLERILAEAAEGQCAYSQRQVGGGRFVLAGSCTFEGVRSTFRNSGTYTPTSYSMNLSSRTVVAGTPIDISIATTSRRIAAACPAGAR